MKQINKKSRVNKGDILLIQEQGYSMIMKLATVKKFSDHLELYGRRHGISYAQPRYATYYFFFNGRYGKVFKITEKELEIELV